MTYSSISSIAQSTDKNPHYSAVSQPSTAGGDVEHAFATYIRILGKGKLGSRSLSFDEAYHAFGMILRGEALDIQIGAFLMLLRVKAESVDEMAGFVQACKDHFRLPMLSQVVEVDWSSYAGKRKHYPWFLLAALTLARHGINVVMHGISGHSATRLYTAQALRVLDMPICERLEDVDHALSQQHFAFMPLNVLSPKLAELIELRDVLGLRSPVHSLVRLLNPFNAKTTLQAIFHPAYREIHQQAAQHLDYQNSVVIKGEGGEFERNPDAKTLLCGNRDGQLYNSELPKINDARTDAESAFDWSIFKAVWLGENDTSILSNYDTRYALQAIIETLAIVLLTMQRVDNYAYAQTLAREMWYTRFRL